jgi:hypothetical protein
MIYVILILVFLTIIAGGLAYLTIGKNKKLKEDLEWMRKEFAKEAVRRVKVEEANKIYVQKLATLVTGTNADRFVAAASIMSDHPVPSPKPAIKP